MSNLPAIQDVPAHLAHRLQAPSQLAQAVSGGLKGGMEHPRISIKGGRFRIIEDGAEVVVNTVELPVIIVGANPNISKIWYSKQWTPETDNNEAPDCYSFDSVSPHPDSGSPQSEACATCPHNAWGSKITPNGQKTKACADQKRLAVVAAGQPDGQIYLLQVTPSALKNLNTYQKELSARGIPAEIVCTKVGFDTDASFPKLTFGFGGFLNEQTQAIVDELFGSEAVQKITGELEVQVAPKMITRQAIPQSNQDTGAFNAEELAAEGAHGFDAPADTPQPAATTRKKTTRKKAAAKKAEPEAPAETPQHGFGEPDPAEDVPEEGLSKEGASALADEVAGLLQGGGFDDAE